ncbi:MAG: hypothetical protein AAF614_34375 [Chloroflexota bacterium]
MHFITSWGGGKGLTAVFHGGSKVVEHDRSLSLSKTISGATLASAGSAYGFLLTLESPWVVFPLTSTGSDSIEIDAKNWSVVSRKRISYFGQ